MDTSVLDSLPSGFWWVMACVCILVVVYLYRSRISFEMACSYWRFPVIGKIARLCKGAEKTPGSYWFSPEIQLLDYFYRWITHEVDRTLWRKAHAYLGRIGESERMEAPAIIWFFIAGITLVEAASFGLIMSPMLAENLAMSYQMKIGYALGLLLAVTLLFCTHGCGRELYKNNKISQIWAWYLSRPIEDLHRSLLPTAIVDLENNDLDEREPIYIQAYNRLGIAGRLKTSYVLTTICAIAVIGLAILGYGTRLALHEALAHAANSGFDGLTSNHLLADTVQTEDSIAKDHAAKMVYACLTILFLLVQVAGISVGYRYGFVGRHSKQAAKIISNFSNERDWIACNDLWRRFIVSRVQSMLSSLQGKLRFVCSSGDFDSTLGARTVQTYLRQRLADEESRNTAEPTLPNGQAADPAAPEDKDSGSANVIRKIR